MRRLGLISVLALAAAPALGAHGILLVSDQLDGVASPQFFDKYYEEAVRDAGYTYAKWDHAARGEVPYDVLSRYSFVIWYTSTSGQAPASDPLRGNLTLSPAEQLALERYLSETPGTTALWLSGMYIAWNCVADADNEKQFYKPLFSDYLKLNYPQANFNDWIKVDEDWRLRGATGDAVFKGQTYNIIWRHRSTYPDQLEAAAGGSACARWVDPENVEHHRAAVRAEGGKDNGGSYRVLLFACPFENIATPEARLAVMENVLAWSGVAAKKVAAPASLGRVKALFR